MDYKLIFGTTFIYKKIHIVRVYSKILKVTIYDKSNHSLFIHLSESAGYYII